MKNSPVRRSHMPLAAVVISVVFFAAGCIIAVADDAVPGLGVAAFGLWGMLVFLGVDERSPLSEGTRPFAFLAGCPASLFSGAAMLLRPDDFKGGLDDMDSRIVGVVFAVFFGAAGIVGFVKMRRQAGETEGTTVPTEQG